MSLQRVFRFMLIGVMALLLAVTLSPHNGVAAAASNTNVHFIYADNGGCPDTISGFQIASSKLVPTPGSPYSAGRTSCVNTAVFGYNALAATQANAVHGPCLVHSDGDQPQVESFTIDPATGALALVSTMVLSNDPSAQAKDIRIASSGNLVYVTVIPGSAKGNLSSLALGAGCTLTLDQQLAVSKQTYDSILLISPSRLVAISLAQHGIDTYALTPTGGIKFIHSAEGQLAGEDGVASQTFVSSGKQVTELYTGQFRLSTQFDSNAQGGQYTPSTGAFSPLPTSPQTDQSGLSLDYLLYNTAHHYLIGTESFSGSLGVWSAKGSGFTFFGHVRLPEVAFGGPTAMAQLGTQLFVVAPSVIFRCTITSVAPGVQNCAVAAQLSGSNGAVEGVAIL